MSAGNREISAFVDPATVILVLLGKPRSELLALLLG